MTERIQKEREAKIKKDSESVSRVQWNIPENQNQTHELQGTEKERQGTGQSQSPGQQFFQETIR